MIRNIIVLFLFSIDLIGQIQIKKFLYSFNYDNNDSLTSVSAKILLKFIEPIEQDIKIKYDYEYLMNYNIPNLFWSYIIYYNEIKNNINIYNRIFVFYDTNDSCEYVNNLIIPKIDLYKKTYRTIKKLKLIQMQYIHTN